MEVDIERFRALARSSPRLWSTLRYVRLQHSIVSETVPVRVLVRRPKLARLEAQGDAGSLLHRERVERASDDRSGDRFPLRAWSDAGSGLGGQALALPEELPKGCPVDVSGRIRALPHARPVSEGAHERVLSDLLGDVQ